MPEPTGRRINSKPISSKLHHSYIVDAMNKVHSSPPPSSGTHETPPPGKPGKTDPVDGSGSGVPSSGTPSAGGDASPSVDEMIDSFMSSIGSQFMNTTNKSMADLRADDDDS